MDSFTLTAASADPEHAQAELTRIIAANSQLGTPIHVGGGTVWPRPGFGPTHVATAFFARD